MAHKKFSSEFKAKVVIEALKGHKTTNELASEFEVHPTHAVISIARQCELIQLSRASYYRTANNGPILETPENLELMRLIDEEYTRHPFYGLNNPLILNPPAHHTRSYAAAVDF